MLKRFISIWMAALMLLSLASCGTKTPATPAEETHPDVLTDEDLAALAEKEI